MYLHVYQYPGLEYLPLKERYKIIKAAAKEYDRWWAVRSMFQTLKYIFMPIVFLGTIIFLGEERLIDKATAFEVVRSYLPQTSEFDWICYLVVFSIIYLRCVNSSGFEQVVKMYLEVEKIKASKETKKNSPLTMWELGTLSWAESEKKRPNKKWILRWIFIYSLLIGITSIYFISNFPPKIILPAPLMYISVLKNDAFKACKFEFSLLNNGAKTVDELITILTLHTVSDNTISTESVHFKFIDSGKSGSSAGLYLTQEQCHDTEKIKLREILVCRIGGVNYRDCGKSIKLLVDSESSIEIK